MEFQGQLDGKDTATNTKLRIRLDADSADLLVGGNGRGGDIKLGNDANVTKIRLDAGGAESLVPELITETILLSGDTGTMTLTRQSPFGRIPGITLSAAGDMSVGAKDVDDFIRLRDKNGKERVDLDADKGDIRLGGSGKDGDLLLLPSIATNIFDNNQATIWLSAGEGTIRLKSPKVVNNKLEKLRDRILLNAEAGNIRLGGNETDGDLMLFDSNGDNKSLDQATIHLNGTTGNILLRSRNNSGALEDRIHLIADSGDIVLQNADCAEEFDVCDTENLESGMVMVLNPDGTLRRSSEPYDKKVAGVLSGAGDYRPGIVLDKKKSQSRRLPLALIGKVYCMVDARHSSIEVGDLLTTSSTSGHAMKATDPVRAFGAVIGKALQPLQSGYGLIPILIALQ